ncbi:MAG: glycine cleavage system aminomethyltransferase GcvT [Phycisphaerales bacterium]|nr:glycine cleavage system aminomethyltransferase GcvT [Phycisphaerales bacterium]
MLQTPLHDFHVSLGAKMVDFAGWHMPVYYRGITEEHVHTRTNASLFDVSHMGRIRFDGPDVQALLQHVCTRNLKDTAVGQSKYAHVCREDGGILDDVIVSRHAGHWVMVCNASNREKILAWLHRHSAGRKTDILDQTLDTAMFAVQGPAAVSLVESRFGVPVGSLKRYWFVEGSVLGMDYCIYRSGYTGEDGVEAIVPAAAVAMILPYLVSDGGASGECRPAGLGARDTLRMEAAMPLYGHELTEDVDTLSAGQGWCVDLSVDFVGAAAMRAIKAVGLRKKLVGLELEGKRIARQGYPIVRDGAPVGTITSGTMSLTLDKSIAMGFLATEWTEPGTHVSIDLGRKEAPARVVPLPFYRRAK